MSKFIVFTALANASALISGVAFPHEVDGGRATDPVEPGVAAKFKGIAGYEIRDAAPAAPAPVETPVVRESAAARKARLAEEARAAAAGAAPPAEPAVEPEVEAGAGADAEPAADANAPDADAPDADAPAADAPDADAPAAESSGDQ